MNKKKMSVLNKLITFLNDVTDEAEAIIDVAEVDTTDSGEVTLSYTLDSGDVVTVDAEKFVRDANMELLEEGSYLLEDGNFLVVDAEGKIVETVEEVADESAGEEAPIAERKNKKVGQKKVTKIKQSKIRKGIKQEDEVSEDVVEDEKVTITIDGVDYEVDKAVADYIKKLEGEVEVSDAEIEQFKTKVNKFKSEVSQLKSKLPSGKFVSEVKSVNQSKEMSVEASIANALSKMRK